MSPLFELPELFETQQKETLKDVRALGEVGHFENGANVFFSSPFSIFFEGSYFTGRL